MATLVPLAAEEAAARLEGCDLSDWFDPFLGQFVREAAATGGRSFLAQADGSTVGLLVFDPAERVGSVFSRSVSVARELAAAAPAAVGFYSELELDGPRELYRLYARALDSGLTHRFRSAVRLLSPEQDPRVPALLQEVYGDPAERWLRAAAAEGERALGAEVGGELVGLAWVAVAGDQARLHGLTVRAPYRRLGIGTDLVLARLAYARRCGARRGFSEIADRNLASRAAAERAGLRPEGLLYLYGRAVPGARVAPAVGARSA